MINSKENPVEWSQLMSELEDAHEHLGDLIKEMGSKGSLDIEGYSIDIAHIYAHLNRAWNSRDFKGEMSESQWEEFRYFPADLEPIA
ncbi:hypothetical protein [Microbulbifer sp. ZKSA002]|uniref:hypothetical protein n=1 Tax=Microbulbifer sp. ZKSA002 TaxID=3243388 RepID=UPI00403A1E97